jgi:hypothetical protein
MDRYLSLPMRRTFIYGERSLPDRPEDVTADAPDPRELQAHGVAVRCLRLNLRGRPRPNR